MLGGARLSARRPVSPLRMIASLGVVAAVVLSAAVYIERTVSGPAAQPSASPGARPSPIAAGPRCAGLKFGPNLVPVANSAGKRKYDAPPPTVINPARLYLATLTTSQGTITLCLDPNLAPNTVNNFVFLARNGFYDGLTFHRVEPGFVIQGGDPQGNGQGGPGYSFPDEPVRSEYVAGCVAMANAGPNTNGSQFFICTADDSSLPKQYNLFGYVQSGMDVVTKIKVGDVIRTATVQEEQ